MTRAAAMLHRLVSGIQVSAKVVAVIAHPDDEAIGFGAAMSLFQDATVMQVTDGAADIPRIWAGVGATTRAEYAAHRRAERVRAWSAAKWRLPMQELDIPDRETHHQIARVVDRILIALVMTGADAVLTHPYEGGHPDHDACAFAVQTACDRLGDRAPERVEFASYHYHRTRVVGRFFEAQPKPFLVNVGGKTLHRKERAVRAYASQARILSRFNLSREQYRIAPRYDFTKPPAPPVCLYERRGLPFTSAEWRAAIARAA